MALGLEFAEQVRERAEEYGKAHVDLPCGVNP